MSRTVWLAVDTIGYPEGGGHLWAYLNWALGLRALGCEVFWLEPLPVRQSALRPSDLLASLRARLEPFGLARRIALAPGVEGAVPVPLVRDTMPMEAADDADLLLSLRYSTPENIVRRFRRSALIDIDPGLLQIWMASGQIRIATYDTYFSTGETVGQRTARFPDAGRDWHYTPPCVALEWWPVNLAPAGSSFTTVSHWWADEWMEDEQGAYSNSKRDGFLPFLDLPKRVRAPLELALCLSDEDRDERASLESRGWRVQDAASVSGTPEAYQRYIHASRGEWSCVKPSCVRLQNAWVSDRSLCYLASGKPVVVQDTGPSGVLPNGEGMFRFRDIDEAARYLDAVERDYAHQARAARYLAEEVFDAKRVVARVLERALK